MFDAHGTRVRVTRVEFRHYEGVGQDDAGVWTAPDGTRVAWFADPDGNTLAIHQAP